MKREAMPATPCPDCGYPFEEVTSLTGGRRPPSEGDVSLCLNCGAINLFDADGGQRRPTDPEIFARIVSDPVQWEAVERTQAMIRRRGLIRPKVAADAGKERS